MSEQDNSKKLVSDTPQERQRKQKLKLIGVVLFAIVLVVALGALLFDEPRSNKNTKAVYEGVGAVSSEDQRNEVFTKRLAKADKEREKLTAQINELLPLVSLLKKQIEINDINVKSRFSEQEDAVEKLTSSYITPPINGEVKLTTPVEAPVTNKDIEDLLKQNKSRSPLEPPKISRKTLEGGQVYKPNPFQAKPTRGLDSDSAVLSLDDSTPSSSKRMSNKDVLSVKEKYIENKMAGWLPATSAVPIVVFTGLDAKAGGGTTGEPEPVHFRFQDDAVLPGNTSYRLAGCRGVAVGVGDLSSVRVKLKASRIVCIDVLENQILETEINGFITDSDGTFGFRGKLNNREGNIAAKAFAATFIEGAAQLIQSANTSTQFLPGSAVSSLNPGSALQSGIAGGSQNAAKILSERYIEQMEAISPTIGIGKGRKGTLHISEGTALEWAPYSGAFRKKITPISKGDD
mgnify:CR=1 FL=1